MNKKKYIEKKSGRKYYFNKYKKLKHRKMIFSDLPFYESMCKYSYNNKYEHNFLNYNHAYNFLLSRIGYNWDDVYSELKQKIKKKHSYLYILLYNQWFYGIDIFKYVLYDEKTKLPYNTHGNLLINSFFIDENNILNYFDTKEKYFNFIKIKKFYNILDKNINNAYKKLRKEYKIKIIENFKKQNNLFYL